MSVTWTPGWLTVAAICAVTLLTVGFLWLGLAGQIRRRFSTRLPEATPRYSLATIETFISKVGRRGLRMYRRQLAWDMLFALLLSISFVPILRGLWLNAFAHPSWIQRVSVWALPAIYLAAEIVEDSFLLKTLERPEPDPAKLPWTRRVIEFFKGGLRRGPFREFARIRSRLALLVARWATRVKFAALGAMASLLVIGIVLLWLNGAGGIQRG